MTSDAELNRRIHDYLEAGPAEMSDRVLLAARAELKTTRRRHHRLARLTPWRDRTMAQRTQILLAAGGVLVLMAAIGAATLGPFGQRDGGVGSSIPPTATPTAAPSATLPSPSASPSPGSSAVATSPTPSPAFVAPIVQRAAVTDKEAAIAISSGAKTTFGSPVLAPDGRIWVPANDLDRIRIYDQNLQLVETWGTPGTGDGQFRFGHDADGGRAGIVFAPDGSFYVLDAGNARVERFSADRTFLGAFGGPGTGDGRFVAPIAIGLDDAPNLYVSDAGRNDVQVFTPSGTYVRTVATGGAGTALWGSGPGWFITTRLPDGKPGTIEYHADGQIQGGWNVGPWGCEPVGVTRDQAPRNIYLTCLASGDATGYLFRFDQTGYLLRAWPVPARGVAVTPDGTRAFTTSIDERNLSRWDLEPPAG